MHPTRRTALASLVPLPADNGPDYDEMAVEVVMLDYEAGWRYPVRPGDLARIAATLAALGVQW
jgi:hypothetical protein